MADQPTSPTEAIVNDDPRSRWFVFSSQSGAPFADLICDRLARCRRCDIDRMTFADGEKYARIEMEDDPKFLADRNVVYVSSTHNDEDLLELIRVGSALAGYGSRKRIFCIPFFGYSTMERAVKLGEVVTAKVNCRLLSAIPNTASGNTFLFLDLHVAGLLHYFETDCVRALLTAVDLLEEALFEWLATATTVEKGGDGDGAEDGGGNASDAKLSHNLLFASADLGRPKVIETLANRHGTDVAFIRKSRDLDHSRVRNVVGDVAGKDVVIYDDMTRSGGTLMHAADAYFAAGARTVVALLSHLAFTSEEVIAAIEASSISRVIGTNSHPMANHARILDPDSKFTVVDVSGVFADWISYQRE